MLTPISNGCILPRTATNQTTPFKMVERRERRRISKPVRTSTLTNNSKNGERNCYCDAAEERRERTNINVHGNMLYFWKQYCYCGAHIHIFQSPSIQYAHFCENVMYGWDWVMNDELKHIAQHHCRTVLSNDVSLYTLCYFINVRQSTLCSRRVLTRK